MIKSDLDKSKEYRSIFLHERWAHQEYFGWHVVDAAPGLRVLMKRYLIFRRYLMLLEANGTPQLSGAIRRAARLSNMSEIVIHDFDSVLFDPPEYHGCFFQRAGKQQRLLNVSTFVVNLALPKEELWRKLGDKSRNMVRRAEQQGAVFLSNADAGNTLSLFFQLYNDMSQRKGFITPSEDVLRKMLGDGRVMLLRLADKSGGTQSINSIYTADDRAYSLYTANISNVLTGFGQCLQWKTIEYLKGMQLRWYDLGGAGEKYKEDGIFTFKKSIGGDYYDLGEEYYFSGRVLRSARSLSALRNSS